MIKLALEIFKRPGDPGDRERSEHVLMAFLTALTCTDQLWLRYHPDTPRLYAAGVRYVREPFGEEEWKDIPDTLRDRIGDCEDLACWLAAERREYDNVDALPQLVGHYVNGRFSYHVRVELPDGTIEDPSVKLGMTDASPRAWKVAA